MPDYLADREREEHQHFVGIASDGCKWAVFELAGSKLVKVKETVLNPEEAGLFLAWLDGALALKASLPPDALTIRSELGNGSVAYHLVNARLRALWDKLKSERAISLKRQLWAELLKLVYGREIESDALWFQHTFLVIVAKCIALAVMQMREDNPKRLLSGEAFTAAGINGAVESDFFDWIVADAEGWFLSSDMIFSERKRTGVVVQFEIRASLIVTSVLNTLCNNFVSSNMIVGIKEAACICDSSGRVAGCFICELNSCYRCMYPSSRATGH